MRFLVAIVALVMLAVAGPASAGSVPGELSRHCSLSGNPISEASSHPLIGIWDGDWDGKLKHTLIVYKVTGERVFVSTMPTASIGRGASTGAVARGRQGQSSITTSSSTRSGMVPRSHTGPWTTTISSEYTRRVGASVTPISSAFTDMMPRTS